MSSLILACLSGAVNVNAATNIQNLTVEYAKNPIGIDTLHPRFAWQMDSDLQDIRQNSFQIRVKDSQGRIVWDSGKVDSEASLGIEFPKDNLQPAEQYQWTLTVWDNKGKVHSELATFETSFLDSTLDSWSGAKWIGVASKDLPLVSHYLPVFNISYTLQLDRASHAKRAGMIFGANDPRLLDKNKNIYNLENKKNGSYVEIELDTSAVDGSSDGLAKLNVYRVGYSPEDRSDKPLFSYPIPIDVINADNQYQPHSFKLTSVFGSIDIHVDGEKYEIPKEPSQSPFVIKSVNINPLGQGSDFIAFPMLADIGFKVGKGQKVSVSEFTVSNYRAPANILLSEQFKDNYQGVFKSRLGEQVAIKNKQLTLDATADDLFVVANPSQNSLPLLRREFTASKPVKSARLYVTARGIYEAHVNGQSVSKDYFNPGLTQYDKSQTYQTFDITNAIHKGKNAIGIALGEGWWSGNQTFIGKAWNYFGDTPSVLSKIVVTYQDGSKETVVSEPEKWKTFSQGPRVYGSLFQGEIYDATKEAQIAGWTSPNFDDAHWHQSTEVKTEGTTYPDSEDFYYGSFKLMGWSKFDDFNKTKMASQFNDSVQVSAEISALSVKEVRPGVFVYDLGQNIAGVPQIVINDGQAGQKLTLRYSEVTYPDMPEYKDNAGMLMLENIRGAHAQDEYVLKGGRNVISPKFTYHGFRYLEITGLDKAIPVGQVKGLALSSVHALDSYFNSSNAKVNKLWENITWSLRSNFVSIPTDCPQRNERMGWSGDLSVFAPTATYLSNQPLFLRRHMLAMRDTQSSEGRFDDVAPIGGGFGGLLWGSAGITTAWESYQQYNDLALLESHFNAMSKYIDYLAKTTPEKAGFLGDWLSPEGTQMGGNEANYLIWDAYYAYDLKLMMKMAKALHKPELAEQYNAMYQQQKTKFNMTYIDPMSKKTIGANDRKLIDSQASYAIPLGLDVVDDKYRAAFAKNFFDHLANPVKDDQGVERPAYSLMTGFIGTAWISKALVDAGYPDAAYKMLQQESYPSWLYSVDQGATTIWERSNSYTKEAGFGGNNSMNSFNHYSFGAVGAWLYNYSLGIQRDEHSPGFKHFILSPQPDKTGKMTYAKGYYDSMYGRIESGWQLKGTTLHYHTVIPANTSATVYLPSSADSKVTVNGNKLSEDGYTYKSGKVSVEVGSGVYDFVTEL